MATAQKNLGSKIIILVMVLFSFSVITAMFFIANVNEVRRKARDTELEARQQKLAVLGKVPGFELTERGGQKVTLETLRGKVWIADFIFTHCAGPCPVMSSQMAEVQKAVDGAPRVQLVTFTVDPDRDTPETLAQYADKYGASKTQWLFLTGPKQDLFKLVRDGFKLVLDLDPPDENGEGGGILHSTKFVLVDARGQIRGLYDGTDADGIPQLLKDAEALVHERVQ